MPTLTLEQTIPWKSAVIGLPDDVEKKVRLETDHENMCRYDGETREDLSNYKLVQINIKELYDAACQIYSKEHIAHYTLPWSYGSDHFRYSPEACIRNRYF